jgi:hypothetical protein
MVNVGNGIGITMGGVPIGISGIAEGAMVGVSGGGIYIVGMGVFGTGEGAIVGVSGGGIYTVGEIGVAVAGAGRSVGVFVSGPARVGNDGVSVDMISSVDVNVPFGSGVRGSAVELGTEAVGNGGEN